MGDDDGVKFQALRLEVAYLRRKVDKKNMVIEDFRDRTEQLEAEVRALRKKLSNYCDSKNKTFTINENGDRVYDELFSLSRADLVALNGIDVSAKFDRKFISDAAVALYGKMVLKASSVTGKRAKGGECKPRLDPKGIQIIHELMEERLDQCRQNSKSKPIDEDRSSLRRIEKTLRIKIANLNKVPLYEYPEGITLDDLESFKNFINENCSSGSGKEES